MKTARILTISLIVLAAIFSLANVSKAAPLGTSFTYQGHLYDANDIANGPYDFQFKLYDASSGVGQVGGDVNHANVNVISGYFTVELDFGVGVFAGDARWLDIGVRPGEQNDPNTYSALAPRQKVTPAPHAIYAKSAGSLANSSFWNLSGNSGTSSSTDFLGTIDDVALEIRVNNKRGFRIEPDDVSPNIIGGSSVNSVTAGALGATISGGGADFALLDQPNIATDDYCTVSGGRKNQAGNNDGTTNNTTYATVGGGWSNTASGGSSTIGGGNISTASGAYSTVGGGYGNDATQKHATIGGGRQNDATAEDSTVGGGWYNIANGRYSTIGGGTNNLAGLAQYATVGGGRKNKAYGLGTTIGGGEENVVTAISVYSAIGGGRDNSIDGATATIAGGFKNTADNTYATVGGGYSNAASGLDSTVAGGWTNIASGLYAPTVGGGHSNIASGEYATVPGGASNEADGNYSFAAGRRAKANADGSFVWGDSSNVDVACAVANRWLVRSSGGVYFYTEPGLGAGVYISAGGTAWNSISDRATKEKFEPVDGLEVLERLAAMPIAEYKLKTQDDSIRHIGPVAQDFAVFGYGESSKAINMEDADGVSFAAIQGLYKIVQEKDSEIVTLETRLAALEAVVARLAERQEGEDR